MLADVYQGIQALCALFVLSHHLISGLGREHQGTTRLTFICTSFLSFPLSYYSLGGSFHEYAFLKIGCVLVPELEMGSEDDCFGTFIFAFFSCYLF